MLLAATCLLPASASAKTMTLRTALRYAGTAPLPDVSAQTSQPPKQLTVSGCKRRSTRSFLCDVTVDYVPVAQKGPAQTSPPSAQYRVRVYYPTRHSRIPRVKVVGPVPVVG